MKKINYLPIWGIVFLLIGIANLYLGFQIQRGMSLVLGGVFVLIGILYFSTPAVVYSSSKIELKNLLGMSMKTYRLDKDDISIKNGRVYSNGKKIPISPLRVSKSEMNKMAEFISNLIDQNDLVKTQVTKKVSDDEELLDA